MKPNIIMVIVHCLSGCTTKKSRVSVHDFFLYTPGVQYLILTRFHVKHKKHDLYKKNMIYIRKTIKKKQ